MFRRAPDETVRYAIDALRDTNTRLCAVLERQTAVDEARVALERERFTAEQAERARAREELAARLRTAEGEDLPAVVREQIQLFSGGDSVLRSQLMGFARTRLGRDIAPEQVAREIRLGDRLPTT